MNSAARVGNQRGEPIYAAVGTWWGADVTAAVSSSRLDLAPVLSGGGTITGLAFLVAQCCLSERMWDVHRKWNRTLEEQEKRGQHRAASNGKKI